MTRRTSVLLSALALAAGCRETPTPPSGATGAATAETTTAATPTTMATAVSTAATTPTTATTAAAAPTASASAAPSLPSRTWSFDKDKPDEPPAGFEFFKSGGKPGKWVVKAETTAPSAPNVLAQLDTDKTESRFATAILKEPPVRDARVSTRCKPISGKADQACGVVLRFKDEKSYYVARVNALEKDVNLYVVTGGKRLELGGWKGANLGDAWHELRLDAKAEHFELYWDGTRVFDTNDKTLPDAGRVGLWTKADSVTYFDELTVTPL